MKSSALSDRRHGGGGEQRHKSRTIGAMRKVQAIYSDYARTRILHTIGKAEGEKVQNVRRH